MVSDDPIVASPDRPAASSPRVSISGVKDLEQDQDPLTHCQQAEAGQCCYLCYANENIVAKLLDF